MSLPVIAKIYYDQRQLKHLNLSKRIMHSRVVCSFFLCFRSLYFAAGADECSGHFDPYGCVSPIHDHQRSLSS